MRSADPAARLELDEVIAELVDRYEHPDDWPAEHRCVKSFGYDPMLGYDQRASVDGSIEVHKTSCDHGSGLSLIGRLGDLIEPGQRAVQENPGKAPSGPKGSPAPWSARPAELIDEILRGAIDMHDTTRRVLGLKPDPKYTDTHLDQRGSNALRALPADILMLEGRGKEDHWLAVSACPGRPKCTVGSQHRHPGGIERAVRAWHRRALLVTGHEQKRAKVGQVLNPLHPDNTERYYRGPIHQRPPFKSCDVHESCEQMRQDRMHRYQQARCPWCQSVSLEQDPVTGHVECVRPGCRDHEGHRHMWTVDELAHLGLVIVTEQGA